VDSMHLEIVLHAVDSMLRLCMEMELERVHLVRSTVLNNWDLSLEVVSCRLFIEIDLDGEPVDLHRLSGQGLIFGVEFNVTILDCKSLPGTNFIDS